MASRDISLTPRVEDTRDAYPVFIPIQFSLSEIKQHFTDSMDEVKGQFAVAVKWFGDHKLFWRRDYLIFIFMKLVSIA